MPGGKNHRQVRLAGEHPASLPIISEGGKRGGKEEKLKGLRGKEWMTHGPYSLSYGLSAGGQKNAPN